MCAALCHIGGDSPSPAGDATSVKVVEMAGATQESLVTKPLVVGHSACEHGVPGEHVRWQCGRQEETVTACARPRWNFLWPAVPAVVACNTALQNLMSKYKLQGLLGQGRYGHVYSAMPECKSDITLVICHQGVIE